MPGLLDLLFGRTSTDPENSLWDPLEQESKDLELHAENCGRRWAANVAIMRDLQRTITQVRFIVIIIVILMAANSSPRVADVVHSVAGLIVGGK